MNHTEKKVHALYWSQHLNRAITLLLCLGDSFLDAIVPIKLHAAVDMHGAGLFRSHCGLVALMFSSIIDSRDGHSDKNMASLCSVLPKPSQTGSDLCSAGIFVPTALGLPAQSPTVQTVCFAENFLHASGILP